MEEDLKTVFYDLRVKFTPLPPDGWITGGKKKKLADAGP